MLLGRIQAASHPPASPASPCQPPVTSQETPVD
jgi:hypothetical protein